MPAGHADAPGDGHGDPDDTGGPPLRGRPILLVDIDRLLEGSADVEHLEHEALRTWRADLTLVLESLTYARAVLAGDVAILRRAAAAEVSDERSLVDDLPQVLGSEWGEGASAEPGGDEPGGGEPDVDAEIGEDLFTRTDELLAAHQEMAEVDLSSPFDAAGSLAVVQEQLAALTERQEAVEARLQQIRAAIIRRYEEGEASAHDQPA